MNEIINWMIMLFLVLGALDYAIGCRYGLGKEFENGILAGGAFLVTVQPSQKGKGTFKNVFKLQLVLSE